MKHQPLNALPKGYRFHEYKLVRPLGIGGFGITYLGFDLYLNKTVAIKEYLPSDIALRTENGCVSPQIVDYKDEYDWGLHRFLEEARTLARFDHRNITKVYRYFDANDTAYIVMEYAEGKTLSEILQRQGTLMISDLQRIILPLLDGLQVVHDADFLHRDIKPGNIIIRNEDESPVLLDFGAARQDLCERSKSVTSIVTPGYAPIEQYTSRGHQGPWTDIYAIGAVSYKALTGEAPITAVDRIQDDHLVPLTRRVKNGDKFGFLKAIDWALQVRELDRPQNLAEWRLTLTPPKNKSKVVLAHSDLPKNSDSVRSPNTPPHSDPPKLSETTRSLNKFASWSFAVPVLLGLILILMVAVLDSKTENERNVDQLRRTESEAAHGNSRAQYKLGVMYEQGLGVPRDYTEAVKWYKLAAERDNSDAQHSLGMMYAYGKGVIKDSRQAVRWYRNAAEQGHTGAQNDLATMYSSGIGIQMNKKEAIQWYRKAAEQGHTLAQYNLGISYDNGVGVAENDYEAVRWYRKAAEQGNGLAQYQLGVKYDNGDGVNENDVEAFKEPLIKFLALISWMK